MITKRGTCEFSYSLLSETARNLNNKAMSLNNTRHSHVNQFEYTEMALLLLKIGKLVMQLQASLNDRDN